MISVIICTFNPSSIYITQAIDSVFRQTINRDNFEFFIVDNRSTIDLNKIEIIKKNNIKIYRENTPGLTAARKCGFENASGDIIVFLDDDNILDEKYLEEVIHIFENEYIGVVGGEISPEGILSYPNYFDKIASSIAIKKIPTDHLYLTSIPECTGFFPIGAGFCIRRAILTKYYNSLNDFNRIEGRTGKSLTSGEDIDIDFFAISIGYLIGVTKKLKLKHLIPMSRLQIRYLIKLRKAQVQSSYFVNKKWKNHFNTNVFPIFNKSVISVLLKAIILLLFYPNPKFRLSFHSNLDLFRVLLCIRRDNQINR